MAIAVPLGPSMAINGHINGHRWAFVKDDPIDRNRNFFITKIRSKWPYSKFWRKLHANCWRLIYLLRKRSQLGLQPAFRTHILFFLEVFSLLRTFHFFVIASKTLNDGILFNVFHRNKDSVTRPPHKFLNQLFFN